MGRRKAFRRMIKEPDELLSSTEHVVHYVRENPNRALIWAGAAVVALLLVLGGRLIAGQRREKMNALAGEAFAAYQEGREDKEKIAAGIRKNEEMAREYPGSAAGQLALYHSADLHFLAGDYAKAGEAYKRLAEEADEPLLRSLARKNLANVAAQKGDYQAARSTLEGLLSADSGLPKAGILSELADIYEKSGDAAKAKAAWQELADDYPGTPWSREARARLGLPPEKEKES